MGDGLWGNSIPWLAAKFAFGNLQMKGCFGVTGIKVISDELLREMLLYMLENKCDIRRVTDAFGIPRVVTVYCKFKNDLKQNHPALYEVAKPFLDQTPMLNKIFYLTYKYLSSKFLLLDDFAEEEGVPLEEVKGYLVELLPYIDQLLAEEVKKKMDNSTKVNPAVEADQNIRLNEASTNSEHSGSNNGNDSRMEQTREAAERITILFVQYCSLEQAARESGLDEVYCEDLIKGYIRGEFGVPDEKLAEDAKILLDEVHAQNSGNQNGTDEIEAWKQERLEYTQKLIVKLEQEKSIDKAASSLEIKEHTVFEHLIMYKIGLFNGTVQCLTENIEKMLKEYSKSYTGRKGERRSREERRNSVIMQMLFYLKCNNMDEVATVFKTRGAIVSINFKQYKDGKLGIVFNKVIREVENKKHENRQKK